MTDPASPEESDLCTRCGICCDGPLFDQALVEPDEVPGLKAVGLPVQEVIGGTGFFLGCSKLQGRTCTIYADRPKVCRTYRCLTLNQLRAGKLEMAEANRRVTATLAAAARARDEFLPGEDFREARIRRRAALAEPDGHRASPRFMLLLGALDLMLDRYFRHKNQRHLNRDME